MSIPFGYKKIVLFHTFIWICCVSLANDNLFMQARTLQREGKHEEAIEAFKGYLSQPKGDELSNEEMVMYTDALVQLMNTYEERPIGGLGIFLIRQIMNEVRYARIDGKNILTLEKKL